MRTIHKDVNVFRVQYRPSLAIARPSSIVDCEMHCSSADFSSADFSSADFSSADHFCRPLLQGQLKPPAAEWAGLLGVVPTRTSRGKQPPAHRK